MFYDDDANSNRAGKAADNQLLDEYDHIICLNRGEAMIIGTDTELVFIGTDFIWGEQARFALQAPDDVSILRLELFARRFQYYKKEIDVNFGDKITIGSDLQLCLLPKVNEKGQIYVGVHSADRKQVQKSLFNHIIGEPKND